MAQEQALAALRTALETFERPAFPCALIAGDVVLLDLLSRVGALDSGRVTVVFIDTFHLFPETITLLHHLEVPETVKPPFASCMPLLDLRLVDFASLVLFL